MLTPLQKKNVAKSICFLASERLYTYTNLPLGNIEEGTGRRVVLSHIVAVNFLGGGAMLLVCVFMPSGKKYDLLGCEEDAIFP